MTNILSILAVLLVVIALMGEVYEKEISASGKAGKLVKWLKAHALNVAVAVDILIAEHKEFLHSIHEMKFEHLPHWVWIVAALIVLSYIAKNAKQRKIARLAAAAVTVVETA